MMNKKTLGIAGAVVLLILIVNGFVNKSDRGAGSLDGPPPTATVQRGDLAISVRGSGTIQSKNAHKIIPKIKSQGVVSYLIPNGERVKKNDVVARLNTDKIENRVEELEAQLDERQGVLDGRTSDLDIQKIDNATNLKSAEQELTKAKLRLEQFLQGDQPLRRRDATLGVKQAENDLERFKKRHSELQSLLDEGFVTEDEVEEAAQNVETSSINLDSARIKQDILENYDLVLDLANAEILVAKAETELEKTKKTTERLLRVKERAVAAAERDVLRVEDEIEQNKEELKSFEIQAPSDGVVQYGDPTQRWRQSEIQVGMTLHSGRVLMTIPDLSELKTVVNISESDIRRVKLDQRAVLTVEALAGKALNGKVVKVAEVANTANHWGGSDVNEFSVELSLDTNGELKPGFSCQAEIFTDTVEAALQVPVQSVFRDDDTFYVYPVKGEAGNRRPVTIGEATTTHVQILEGVEEGEEVFLARPVNEELAP